MTDDTIFALSSGGLPSGVAVIRISGPQTRAVLLSLCGHVPAPRMASFQSIHRRNGELLDKGIVLYFQGPASFTGEDAAELQVHGGRASVRAILEELAGITACRSAEAGEFSRRAFENGRIDLTAAEGLADLIEAETEMQRRLANEHAAGGLTSLYDSWAKRLLHARAMVEAEFDFSDEEDVPGSVSATIWPDLRTLLSEVQSHLSASALGQIVRDGFKIVIVGPPNSGKSSLINYLAGKEVAIVTSVAGTTRDVLHVDLDLNGFRVRIFDTAGLRDTDDVVEQEGIRRTRSVLVTADLVLHLTVVGETLENAPSADCPLLRVRTMADLHGDKPVSSGELRISTKTGEGVDDLIAAIALSLPVIETGVSLAVPTRARHIQGLKLLEAWLTEALIEDFSLDVRAESLRSASNALGRITGRVDVENILGVIFSEFCIGK